MDPTIQQKHLETIFCDQPLLTIDAISFGIVQKVFVIEALLGF
jgi:hypothetical protein